MIASWRLPTLYVLVNLIERKQFTSEAFVTKGSTLLAPFCKRTLHGTLYRDAVVEQTEVSTISDNAGSRLPFFPDVKLQDLFLPYDPAAVSLSLDTSIESYDVSVPYDAAARLAFEQWKEKFGKINDYFDSDRFEIFKANYEAITIANIIAKRQVREVSIANGEGAAVITNCRMVLNEYADLTFEEYEALQREKQGFNSSDVLSTGSKNTLEPDNQSVAGDFRIQVAYRAWTTEFNKTSNVTRYATFAKNFLMGEKYCNETGTPMKLNEFADLTEQEYITLTKSVQTNEDEATEVDELQLVQTELTVKQDERQVMVTESGHRKKQLKSLLEIIDEIRKDYLRLTMPPSHPDEDSEKGSQVEQANRHRESIDKIWETSKSITVPGNSLRTWSYANPKVKRVHVLLKTDGRPLVADIELWHGPDSTPHKMKVYAEDGAKYTFSTFVNTPRNPNTIAIRNTGHLEFPIHACVGPDTGAGDFCLEATKGGKSEVIQGGSLRSYTFDYDIDSVAVLIRTKDRPLSGRIELLQGPNNNKQVLELYTEDGLDRPFIAVVQTPGSGNVVQVVNTAPLEFPMFATVVAYTRSSEMYSVDGIQLGLDWQKGKLVH